MHKFDQVCTDDAQVSEVSVVRKQVFLSSFKEILKLLSSHKLRGN